MILAIDPGPTESAYVIVNPDGSVIAAHKVPNAELLSSLGSGGRTCVCERIRSFGMPAGAELFETCEWTGRFWQAWISRSIRHEWHFLTRIEVKTNLCGSSKAKDANVRQAIIDRFGGKDKAIGRKAAPGPLYGISGDCWSALAVALTWYDMNRVKAAGKL